MLPQKILSLQHPFVKHWKKLCIEKKYREAEGSIIIFGKKMVKEVASLYPIKRLLIGENCLFEVPAVETYILPQGIFKKISGMKNPEPIAAEIAIPTATLLYDKQYLLALDRITDPGNLGTLIRSAWAFGIEGILLLPGCVDVFNDKALRAAKGASLHIPFQYIEESELSSYGKNKFTIYLADIEGDDFDKISYTPPLILLLGNEGQGISDRLDKVGNKITISMKNSINSLNVSIAGSLLLYHITNS